MAKTYSPRETKLQKKLIPLNIVVCIIAIVCIFSLMFAPIIKIDLGKMVKNEAFISLIQDSLSDMIGDSSNDLNGLGNLNPFATPVVDRVEGEGEEGGEGNNGGGFSLDNIDYMPILSSVLTDVIGKIEGTITISAQSASKVLFAPEEERAKIAMEQLLLGDAFMGKLVDSIVDGVFDVFKQDSTKEIIEEELIKVIANQVASNLSGTAGDMVTEDDIIELTQTIKKLEKLEEGETPDEVVEEFIEQLNGIFGEDNAMDEETKETIRDFLIDGYNEAVEEIEKQGGDGFSLEALISVAISKNADLSGLSDFLGGGSKSDLKPQGSTLKSLIADDVDDPTDESGEDDKVICTTYEQLLKQMGLDENAIGAAKETVKAYVEDAVDEALGDSIEYISYYGYLYYVMLVFSIPWMIMLLFAFLHIFLKNKRFTMWYVKLFGFFPALIWLALKLVPVLIKNGVIPVEGEVVSIIGIVLGGISSYMWICGLCYLLLWGVSIFWAFPIKHKIRKERRAQKRENKKALKS